MVIKEQSLQNRVITFFLCFTLFVAVIYSLFVLVYSWVVEDNVFNKMVADEVTYIQQSFNETGQIPRPRAAFLNLYSNWDELPEPIYQQHLKDIKRVEFTTNDKTYHLKEFSIDDDSFILLADVTAFEVGKQYFPYISISLIAAFLFITFTAAIMAVGFARRAFDPLIKLSDDVRIAKKQGMATGFHASFPENEIGYLAEQIEKSFLHVQTLLDRERDFTRDVSHELRTPITVLKNKMNDLNKQNILDHTSSRMMNDAIVTLESSIESLLMFAREETTVKEEFLLIEELERAILENHTLVKDTQYEFDIDIPANFNIKSNKDLCKILFRNLITNAWHHSSDKKCKIWMLDPNTLVFENKREGILVSDVFNRHVKGQASKGYGIGLHLVERICHHLGWAVSAHQDEETFQLHIKL